MENNKTRKDRFVYSTNDKVTVKPPKQRSDKNQKRNGGSTSQKKEKK